MSGIRLSMRVWDLPTRLFHWLLVLLVCISWYTGENGPLRLHFLSGYAIFTLLLFRIGWGFFGSDTARFSRFLKSPRLALRHLASLTRRHADTEIGHNAAGGWMVLLLLLLLAAQVGTGLFGRTDFTDAPFAYLIGGAASEKVTEIHEWLFTLIEIAVLVHVLAIILYAVIARQDLVRPMITGKKRLPAAMRAPRMASAAAALGWLVICVLVVGALITFAGR
jgi:cytochrome b